MWGIRFGRGDPKSGRTEVWQFNLHNLWSQVAVGFKLPPETKPPRTAGSRGGSATVGTMAKNGENFARLLVTHDRSLRRYISLFLRRQDDVEEVLQQTAASLWEKFDEFDTDRDFMPWATRFAYFEVLNFRKEKARSRVFFSEDVMEALVQSHEELNEELKFRETKLKECLAELSRNDLLLVQRRYSDDATIKSLSAETGKTVKSLYRRLDRIRELISDCVDRKTQSFPAT